MRAGRIRSIRQSKQKLALTVNGPLRDQLLLNGGLAWVRISKNFPMLDTLRINRGRRSVPSLGDHSRFGLELEN